MRSIRPTNRRPALWSKLLLGLVILILGGAGTVGALGAMKVIDLGRLAFWRKPKTYPADWKRIPICGKPIPAYTIVTRDYLLNPLTGEEAFICVSPEDAKKYAEKGIILDAAKVRGRVTAHEHQVAFGFIESDFLPEGSRAGVAGGTPPGKQAITLDVSKLEGTYDLKAGDHVDLLASVAVDMPGAGKGGSRPGANVVSTPDMMMLPKRGLVRKLVEDGVVITPVRTRAKPISSSSLMQGMTSRTIPVQEIVIAVKPLEAKKLFEAIDLQYEIICLTRSGRPEPVADNRSAAKEKPAPVDDSPDLDPWAGTRYIEVLKGGKREYMVFAGPGNAPTMNLQENGQPAEPENASASADPGNAAPNTKAD